MKISKSPTVLSIALKSSVVSVIVLTSSAAFADENAWNAMKLLKGMSDYLAGEKTFTANYLSDVEVVTPALEKIQFASSGRVSVARPDKVHVSRTGGYVDMEAIFDGKQLSVFGKDANAYAQSDVPGTLDQLINKLQSESLALPGADLLLSNVFDELTKDVVTAKHIGTGVINGVECEHLAFRNRDIDWQLWIRVGEKPIPCKYVITSKTLTGAPQYSLTVTSWDSKAEGEAFTFTPPANAKKVDLAEMDVDEIPPESEGDNR
jgi:hypothetical protein